MRMDGNLIQEALTTSEKAVIDEVRRIVRKEREALEEEKKEFSEQKKAFEAEKSRFMQQKTEFEKKLEEFGKENLQKMIGEQTQSPDSREKEDPNEDLVFFRDRVPLGKIMCYLDPFSFLQFSASCKRLRRFCLNCRQIDVASEKYYLEVKDDDEDNDISIVMKRKVETQDYEDYEDEKMLVKMPILSHMKRLPIRFRFKIKTSGVDLTAANLAIIQKFLNSFRLFSVASLKIYAREIDWPSLTSFLEDIPVKKFSTNVMPPIDFHRQILTLPLDSLMLPGSVEVSLLNYVYIPMMRLDFPQDGGFTIDSLGWLVENWLLSKKVTPIRMWCFSCNFDLDAFFNFFQSSRFITLEDQQMPTEPADRPLVIVKNGNCKAAVVFAPDLSKKFAIFHAFGGSTVEFLGDDKDIEEFLA